MKNIIVTGGQGFIGINLVQKLIKDKKNNVLSIDKISYASNKIISKKKNFKFKKLDINNFINLKKIIINFKPNVIFHLAAETHVDRSINFPKIFLLTNIIGTFNILQICRLLKNCLLVHISTDEVFGSIKKGFFTENSKFFPNSPYSSSKASSDHLVRAWNKTYGIKSIVTNCSNNYGPYQHKEKLIPKTITNLLKRKIIPIFAKGQNLRDWIYVQDHVDALIKISNKGKIGENYNIGSSHVIDNLKLVKKIISIMFKMKLISKIKNHIKFVKDRAGHDFRYSVNNKKIKKLGWNNKIKFNEGLKKTIEWYSKKYS